MKTKVTGYLTQKHGFYYVVLNLPTDEKGKRNRKTLSTEMIIGLNSDPQFGPMLLVGMGGVFVEVFKDAALYPVPLNHDEALHMLQALKSFKLLNGYRGNPPADIEALTDMMVKISDFAYRKKDTLKELDMNPLFVYPKGEGVAIADALAIMYEEEK